MKKKYLILVALISVALIQLSYAVAPNSQMGRYLTVVNKPSTEQINLLSQTIQVRFPQNIQTIGDAMNYLLRFSGYSLVPEAHRSEALKITLTKLLPAIDRNFGPMSLQEGLTTLAGPIFYLMHDPVNRTVNFKLKHNFKQNQFIR